MREQQTLTAIDASVTCAHAAHVGPQAGLCGSACRKVCTASCMSVAEQLQGRLAQAAVRCPVLKCQLAPTDTCMPHSCLNCSNVKRIFPCFMWGHLAYAWTYDLTVVESVLLCRVCTAQHRR